MSKEPGLPIALSLECLRELLAQVSAAMAPKVVENPTASGLERLAEALQAAGAQANLTAHFLRLREKREASGDAAH